MNHYHRVNHHCRILHFRYLLFQFRDGIQNHSSSSMSVSMFTSNGSGGSAIMANIRGYRVSAQRIQTVRSVSSVLELEIDHFASVYLHLIAAPIQYAGAFVQVMTPTDLCRTMVPVGWECTRKKGPNTGVFAGIRIPRSWVPTSARGWTENTPTRPTDTSPTSP